MRLTNDMRDTMLHKAMRGIPSVNYLEMLCPVVQNVIYSNMPASVQLVYDDVASRAYLNTVRVSVKDGNKWFRIPGNFYGASTNRGEYECRIDDAGFSAHRKGTIEWAISSAVRGSGFLRMHIEQKELLDSVRSRLKSTLRSVTTTNRLRDILEPELLHIIPPEGDKTANLPATAAPVVDDLRKLGAKLEAAK